MTRQLAALVPILALTALLASAASPETLDVVPSVDFSRYAGRWYEIARLPNRFQNKCAGEVVAAYSLLEGDQLKVVNECRQENGQTITAEGEARLADQSGRNSKLKVRFAPAWLSWLPMVWGDYWISIWRRIIVLPLLALRIGSIYGYCHVRQSWTMPSTRGSSRKRVPKDLISHAW